MQVAGTGRLRLALLWALCGWMLLAGPFPAPAQAVAADSVVAEQEVDARTALKPVEDFVEDLFGLSTHNVRAKGFRILAIFLICVIAKFSMDMVQLVSRLLIYSERGPLRFIFRNHQRSVTVHNLLISLTKYVVYFTALGYILNELGIDYKTYLASLSLIGIAVGFGSQGLVQDVVTGFFILFENQFSVGDMVEISGQVGVVEAIGLRTTRIRNYFGASIILQNRNIPTASRYPKGAFEVVVDVAIADRAKAEKAAELLQRIGEQLERQFREIIMETPRVLGLVELETGEYFVRLYTEIWPAQQWVVDAQLVPRIREIFKREDIEIPGDRVVSFYHLPGEKSEDPGIMQRILLARQRSRGEPGGKD